MSFACECGGLSPLKPSVPVQGLLYPIGLYYFTCLRITPAPPSAARPRPLSACRLYEHQSVWTGAVYGLKKKSGLTLGTLVLQGSAKMFQNSLFTSQNFVIFRPLQNAQRWSEKVVLWCVLLAMTMLLYCYNRPFFFGERAVWFKVPQFIYFIYHVYVYFKP